MLSMIIGPMFSGKSTELVRRLNRYKIAGKKVLFIRSSKDTRNKIIHNIDFSIDFETLQLEKLSNNLLLKYKDFNVIGIDEGQFFDLLMPYVDQLLNMGKIVVIAGLVLSSELIPFTSMTECLPYAEHITKLNAICNVCKSEYGTFSHYLKDDKNSTIRIGDEREYIAVCRNCYNNMLKD